MSRSTVESSAHSLRTLARWMVLTAVFLGLLFDGFELGLMPVASRSVARSFLGPSFQEAQAGDWFGRWTASGGLGGASGGMCLGWVGGWRGGSSEMGISIICCSLFAGRGGLVQTPHQMLWLRFCVGLGVGGMWPNGIALVAECWPQLARPWVAGIAAAGINAGILFLSQVARVWPITADSWLWLFAWSAVPRGLGGLILLWLPESPHWLATRGTVRSRPATPGRDLWSACWRRNTCCGILLGTIPLVGAWAASKWMIPWADQVGGSAQPRYKAITQGYWAVGASLGSVCGAHVADVLGKRWSYFLMSLGAALSTWSLFCWTAPVQSTFLPWVFVQGWISTLLFGWLPLYLPDLFPVEIRATGVGVSYNSGRFLTAVGVLAAGFLAASLGGDYARVGAWSSTVYLLGTLAVWFIPRDSH